MGKSIKQFVTLLTVSHSTLSTLASSSSIKLFLPYSVDEGPKHIYTNVNGTFTYSSDLPGAASLDPYVNSVAIADFDGDGVDDILLGHFSAEPTLIFRNGTVVTLPVDANRWFVKAADMNSDGFPDIVLIKYSGGANDNKLLLNDGTGGFPTTPVDAMVNTPTFSGVTYHWDVCFFDVNGDGALDAVEVFYGGYLGNGGPVLLHLNKNDGSGQLEFHSELSTEYFSPWNCELGDINGDGYTDIVVGNQEQTDRDYNMAYLNNGDLTFTPQQIPGKARVALADVDNDGDLDMIASVSYGRFHSIFRNDGTGQFSADANPLPTPGDTIMYPRQYIVVDLNGDGWLDIIIGNGSTGENKEVFVLMNDGTGGDWTIVSVDGTDVNPVHNMALLDVPHDAAELSLQDIQAQSASLALDTCNVELTSPPSVILECIFDSTRSASAKAEILIGSCAHNGNFARPAEGESVIDAKVVTRINFTSEITDTEKNSGSVTETFCTRVDVFANEISVGAVKYDIEVTLTYSTTGNFVIESIRTAPFTATDTDASATRESSISAYRCDESGSEISGVVVLGSTLHICLYSPDSDVSLQVTQLDLEDTDGNTLATPVDGTSGPNFVTTIGEKNVVPSGGSDTVQAQVVSTLMVPSIFDAAGGDVISAIGAADITYNRRMLAETTRSLQVQEEEEVEDTVAFNVEFTLERNGLPMIAQNGAASSIADGKKKVPFTIHALAVMTVAVLFNVIG